MTRHLALAGTVALAVACADAPTTPAAPEATPAAPLAAVSMASAYDSVGCPVPFDVSLHPILKWWPQNTPCRIPHPPRPGRPGPQNHNLWVQVLYEGKRHDYIRLDVEPAVNVRSGYSNLHAIRRDFWTGGRGDGWAVLPLMQFALRIHAKPLGDAGDTVIITDPIRTVSMHGWTGVYERDGLPIWLLNDTITFAAYRPNGEITGTFSPASTDAVVDLYSSHDTGASTWWRADVNSDGEFSFGMMETGTYVMDGILHACGTVYRTQREVSIRKGKAAHFDLVVRPAC